MWLDGTAGPHTVLVTAVPASGETPARGLTSSEAARRLAEDGPNELPGDGPTGWFSRVLEVLSEPMLLLLVAAGAISIAVAETLDGVLLLSTTVVVVATSVIQGQRTEHAVRSLREMTSPPVSVERDGVRLSLPAREVVRGDLVFVAEGNRIPADAVLASGSVLTVDESVLSGESVPVTKEAEGDRDLWSGTLVTSGQSAARVTATGGRSRLGEIGASLASITVAGTSLQREIRLVVRVLGAVGLAAALTVTVAYAQTRGGWADGAIMGIATAMSLLPEEFPVVLTIFLALGALRMSREKVLARRLAAVEALGAVTVVCTDKTGTLTTNSMTVTEVLAEPGFTASEVLAAAVLAVPDDPFDPMDRAFLVRAPQPITPRRPVRTYPLAPGVLAHAQVVSTGDEELFAVAMKGAPESVAVLCGLDPDERRRYLQTVETAAARGLRMIAVALASHARDVQLPSAHSGFAFRMVGTAGLKDPLRPGARDAVDNCARAGVRTVMITGDHPATALAIAAEAGIDTSGGCVAGTEVAVLDDTALAARMQSSSVCARITPEQKLRLVRALQSNGEVVAMTGDGVNDAPALRAADVGIALGRRATDVAREAASIVVTDDDLSSLARGIARGRGIYDNLAKTTSYLISVHVLVFGMSLVPLAAPGLPVVLLPLQIAMLELVIDPACSILFQMEPHDPDLMTRPPRGRAARMFGTRRAVVSLAQGAVSLAAVCAVWVWAASRGGSDESVRALAFVALSVSNLLLILVNRSWRLTVLGTVRARKNPAVPWTVVANLVVVVTLLSVGSLRSAFHLGTVSPLEATVACAVAAAGVAWFEIAKVVGRRRGRPGPVTRR
jgi:Ca2+-transporting ATPase